ncbi:hypothetical protein A3E69_03365 [Candidatus Roizmanbacteria bacterium RIFCSPHIGHO2_12_FULL_40_130]|nr:MAG: hypothetical protein A2779_02245 [Candidatus Roizmanbacteria bacterium RIFCSPHIGHO2_01_FULL_40_98]OGK36750.1 MAG: hypothetical protein A3E69_03365 [Candidatus Roizmanbacteria bacterium RIFCSPHIGHO2_12_FULL_40_130]
MNIERGFVPLPQVDSQRVTLDLDLPPYAQKENIGVNVRALHSLCKLAGIEHLVIRSVTGPTSTFDPMITGITSDGTAIAAKVGLKKLVPMHESHIFGLRERIGEDLKWSDGEIEINMSELTRRLIHGKREGKEGNLHGSKDWAQKLNKAIKGGMLDLGFSNLVVDQSLGSKLMFFQTITLFGLLYGLSHGDIYTALRVVGVPVEAINLGRRPSYGDYKNEFGEYRYSLFLGLQIDRALLLALKTKTNKLIKSLD